MRSSLLGVGVTDGELRRGRRAGELACVERGAYVAGGDPRLRDEPARHALRIIAAIPRCAADAVVSHVSAAVQHGLPIWALPMDRVHVTRPRRTGGGRSGRLHVHTAPLDPDEMTHVGTVAVTSAARTIVDLARTAPFEQAVVLADAALRRELTTPAQLVAAVDRASGWAGAPRARRVVAFADALSESVGESRSRVLIARAGLPPPELQHDVMRSDGRWLGRVDFWWAELDTVGEFDGLVKYGRLLRPGQEPGDAVVEEKLREDAIRPQVTRFARWTWRELREFALVARRIRGG